MQINLDNYILLCYTDFVIYWRDGRVVEGTSLENWHRVTPYRGFESHSLRQ